MSHRAASFVRILGFLALLALAGCGSEPGGRVLVLGLDGLDPEAVDLLMSEGKLPNLAKMRQHGAYAPLESQKPLLSPIVWTTIATGQTPDRHGIGHFVARSPDGQQLPVTSDMRQVQALWNLASNAERDVVTVGWWATWPPENVRGAVVSDHTAYHFLFEEGLTGEDPSGAPRTFPPELMDEIEPFLRRPADLGPEDLAPYVDVPAEDLEGEFSFEDDLAHFRWALATAESYRDIGLHLWEDREPRLQMVYVEGTDSTAHLFGHLFRAEGLAGELAEQQRRYGRAVEEMYLLADRIVGEYIDALDDDTTLVVLSDHGFVLGELHDDPTKTRDMRRVSEQFHRLHGVLYLYGNRVKRGARIDAPTILDIAPTVLSLLGIAPSRDMPGRVLTEALDIEAPERVTSWEADGGGGGPATRTDATVQEAQLEHLRSLGYLGDAGGELSSPQGDRNLAAILFEQGKYRESAQAYMQLVEENPDDASLRTSLAGALGALGRDDDAREQLAKAIELEPLNVEAFHNRAVLHERVGDLEAAVADYRTALRYAPTYEPSQRALLRLTGSIEVRSATGPDDARAMAFLDEAATAARKADYASAERLLDEAEAVAPAMVLVHQYRSNVAYLQGDVAGAIAALERALELEPDNALFRENLERLREGG